MRANSNRNEFSSKIKEILAKRSGLLCTICKAHTVGPSLESIVSINNIGVAAHITAASPNGPRYDPFISTSARSGIANGIWLCQNHARMIDRDSGTWTVGKLKEVKEDHEEFARKMLGIPIEVGADAAMDSEEYSYQQITPREFGSIAVGSLIQPYKAFINPVIHDKGLNDNSIIGVLMCGSEPKEEGSEKNYRPSWTLFVNNDWLQWFIKGQTSGFQIAQNIAGEQIYGQIPGWPDTFFEFLHAIVQTNTTFEWKRHKDGYLVLAQIPLNT